MDEFLNQYCYISIEGDNKLKLYYLCAKVTDVSDTHISFEDNTKRDEPHTYRKIDVVEIKLSTKKPIDWGKENE
jgi:hypothetical protein